MSEDKGKPGRPVRVNLELPADLEAIYANFTLITHSSSEVIMDFARLLPNTPKTRIYARVLMTPVNAKLLHDALGENLRKFEEKYGEIKAAAQDFETTRQLGFRK
jgi:hypothetical protein